MSTFQKFELYYKEPHLKMSLVVRIASREESLSKIRYLVPRDGVLHFKMR